MGDFCGYPEDYPEEIWNRCENVVTLQREKDFPRTEREGLLPMKPPFFEDLQEEPTDGYSPTGGCGWL